MATCTHMYMYMHTHVHVHTCGGVVAHFIGKLPGVGDHSDERGLIRVHEMHGRIHPN